ncbi:hypothetical protein [Cupriavidus consociatus]|uniref:hypothetical protein n=1 Tax=Cupriavidus consociatus TaxID=2821357 RepID=UPI001AE9FE7B|nr:MULTISPECIES: hypothetical protein [unclassified Cupriavidus]MBP0623648.1 hypothetical protein [Cupriavidus sp. LEh25]MDK2660353.1 hypothetical protein [Cupriavidus sp. LEh21]
MAAEDHGFGDEAARIAHRRRQLGIGPRTHEGQRNWALALSGGGIRSATFCLGVMQAMAGTAMPASTAAAAANTATNTASNSEAPPTPAASTAAAAQTVPGLASLLARFDYLSTVSGGGYLGAFFVSLFVPGRLRRDTGPVQAAAEAYHTLQCEPPGRIHTSASYAADPGRGAVAWLRENGRYLSPTGAGDNLYAAALVMRNWVAMHFVIGSALLVLLSMLALLLHGAAGAWYGFGRYEMDLLHDARQAFNQGECAIWWSPWLWLPLATAVIGAVPPGLAYWLVYPRANDPQAPARFLSPAPLVATLLGLLLLAAARWSEWLGANLVPAQLFAALGALTWLGVLSCLVMLQGEPRTVSGYRVRATRALRTALTLTLWLAALGVADTAARTAYLYAHAAHHPWGAALPAGVLGVLVWLVRYGARWLDEGRKGSAETAWRALWARLPVSLLAGTAAAVLALLLFVLWSWLVLWVRWDGREPVDWLVYGTAYTGPALATLTVVALVLALVAGRFTGFLNLSTLQPFYAARLTRAYLGASNGERFAAPDPDPVADRRRRARFSVAEPVPGDQLGLNAYYDPRVLAPLHLINVTLKLTVDPAEQLVQRDRKGKPLCLAPGASVAQPGAATTIAPDAYARFTIDGWQCCPDASWPSSGKLAQSLTVGDWIAISGAAVSTGLGRATTLGTSLLLGLANLRLGTWWPSYPARYARQGGREGERWRHPERATHPWLAAGMFRTQYYLGCELSARFHGTRRGWQYLADGGHFDSTGVYELLRPGRDVALIVLCDCGGDRDYRFGDLANLIRLARIDHGLEIVVDTEAATHPVLSRVFGVPDDFLPGAAGSGPAADKCAVLLNVYSTDPACAAPRAQVCRIVLLKPRLVSWAPADVRHYGATHPAFPQEGTIDQFFDEAQWESYRALGHAIGQRVLGGDVGKALLG